MAIETRILQGKTVFTDWEVKEYIGSGSGGKTAVFQIVRRHEGWEETSALKVINILEEIGKKDTLAEAYRQEYEAERNELCKQAKEELRLMSCLRGNPYIVEYYDFHLMDYQEENVFGTDLLIRMELLENLREEQKKKGEYTETEIVHIGKDICKSLQFCHQAGIIHRDIKPANIFITEWGDYKLGDFGIARMVDAGQKASTKMGTRAYAAPEQFMSHQDKYDERVDIYSLGLTLYELANHNRLPFASSGYVRESEIQLRIMGKELPALDHISPMVAAVINKACAYDAENRYASAKEFRDALSDAETGALTKQGPTAVNGEKEPEKQKKKVAMDAKVVVVIAMLLLIVILLLVGVSFVFRKDGSEDTAGTVANVETSESETLPEESEQKVPDISLEMEKISNEYMKFFGEVAYVTANNSNVAVITGERKLYIWGTDNEYGQIGCGNTEEQNEPVLVMENVASVCLSEMHTAALTPEGDLYLWGRNSNLEIGNGESDNQLTPTLVMEDVKEVSLGDTHSGALCNNGDLYGWGNPNGNGIGEDRERPTLIASNIAAFSMNSYEGAAISEDGDLYVWGMNWTAQEGFGSVTPIQIMSDVKSVQVGQNTVAAIKTNGNLYVWVYNEYGQVGNGETITVSDPVLILENVKSVALENNYSAAITEDGVLYMWGCNYDGQLGLDGSLQYNTPRMVAENVKSVYLGKRVSAFVKENGDLYLCGDNSNEQIEASERMKIKEPIVVAGKISSVGICRDATYAVREDGSLYCWKKSDINIYGEDSATETDAE